MGTKELSPTFHSEAPRKWAIDYTKALKAAHALHQCILHLKDALTSTPSHAATVKAIPRPSQPANEKSMSEESTYVKLSLTLTTANKISQFSQMNTVLTNQQFQLLTTRESGDLQKEQRPHNEIINNETDHGRFRPKDLGFFEPPWLYRKPL